MREKTDLDKKPTWYLFLAANVLVLLGCVITYVLLVQPEVTNTPINFVPSIVCNLISLVLCGFFIWLESKNTMPQAVHFQRKWLKWYLAALIVFVGAIVFNFIFLVVFLTQTGFFWPSKVTWPLIIYMVITGVLTLVSIGLQRYARYKIDLDIYRRKHGELPKKEEIEKDEAKVEKEIESKMQDKKKKEIDSTPKASSGLADSIDNQ